MAMRHGFEPGTVFSHARHSLATRNGEIVEVDPDVTVLEAGSMSFLVDAKYKRSAGRAEALISRPDMYEAECFLLGAELNTLILVYPRSRSPARNRSTLEVARCSTVLSSITT
jgi:hypothetical protein